MKDKKGFTLIEILSIIAVLGIIVMLVLPNLAGSIEEKKKNELNKLISIIENSAKVYHSFNSDVYKISVSTLIDEEYITTDMVDPNTGEKLDGCVNVVLDENDTYSYIYGSCDGIEVPFSVELSGGTPGQIFNLKYLPSTKIELVDPTSETGKFKGWKIVKGNSILKGNTLIIGTTETILYAVWGSVTD